MGNLGDTRAKGIESKCPPSSGGLLMPLRIDEGSKKSTADENNSQLSNASLLTPSPHFSQFFNRIRPRPYTPLPLYVSHQDIRRKKSRQIQHRRPRVVLAVHAALALALATQLVQLALVLAPLRLAPLVRLDLALRLVAGIERQLSLLLLVVVVVVVLLPVLPHPHGSLLHPLCPLTRAPPTIFFKLRVRLGV
ncbi:hypothetical protein MPH_06054 [Macrophomina phaseolina MS6]|uniref:Uncharacterized protein n=1 Tax=Macrophomina phaseolina (strain MS6) TaxID=1126212 RepID=K2RPN3_MACPH|nr:hypothetical protein MPH_06054 [Macrophomina phaseolina MS6]